MRLTFVDSYGLGAGLCREYMRFMRLSVGHLFKNLLPTMEFIARAINTQGISSRDAGGSGSCGISLLLLCFTTPPPSP